VDTVEEAAKAAGFVPRLPDWNVVGERPTETRFRVVAAVSARVTIDVNRLRQILREEGKNFNVPQSWDGAEFISETGAAIIAMFDDRLMVAQYPPTEARVPAGFPLAQIRNVRKLLEPGGLSTEQILRLRTGDVLQGIDPDPEIDAHEVKLKSGRGVFVQNNSSHPTHTQTCFFCPVYPHESVIAWIVPDRQFVVRASYATEELLVRVANSIR
jgi:hypothetical protein